MERLVVKNFLLLQDVDFEIKKYNFLLGPQASGKSVLAKLLYFIFHIPHLIEVNLNEKKNKESILDTLKDHFKDIFPESYWKNEVFEIIYYSDDFFIKLENKEKKLKTLEFSFSKNYSNTMESILDISKNIEIKNRKKSLEELIDNNSVHETESYASKINDYINNKPALKKYFSRSRSIFIPSSRCVYSLLADRPATNSKTFSSDYFLNNFGGLYEELKEFYEKICIKHDLGAEYNLRVERILKGKYKYDKKSDYLVLPDKKVISVKYVSSGQQEVLPLLIMLGLYSVVNYNLKYNNNFPNRFYFIEEPEAHLFPEAQVEIMSLLSLIGFESNMPFFITTHSPYLLSVLNNFLYGTKLIDDGKINFEHYKKITKGARPIKTNEVFAFTLKEGKSVSLMDEEGVFIDSNVLDNASDIINNMYDSFIDQK